MARTTKCPFCTGNVLTKNAGRAVATITGFLQRSFNIRIPTDIVSFITDNLPVSKKSLFKEKCGACGGKGSIEDPSDDSEKMESVKQLAESKAEEILELEKKLAPPCGNRYTVIQGCDLLEVGLGMNNAPSYRVDKDKSMRSKGLIDPSKVNTKKGGPQIPEGGKCNHVQGITSLASPGGHYMIKCSNKFSVIAGAQGVDISTGGPLTISGGITKIVAPEIMIGSQVGRLSLNGDVVDISGRSIEMAPTDGHVFVRGTISNTGNLMVGGHTHSESVSFTKAECVGRNEVTKPSSSSDIIDGPAFWGGVNGEGITHAVKDLMGFVTSKIANPVEAQQIMTPRFVGGLRDKMLNLSYHVRPWELKPTGYILPGTSITLLASCPCNYPTPGSTTAPGIVTGIVTAPINLNNFPHSHAQPDNVHNHEVRIPDIECSADSAQEVRSKQGGVSQAAPLQKTSKSGIQQVLGLFSSISTVFVSTWNAIQGTTGPYTK
jgi:hypothetical protein